MDIHAPIQPAFEVGILPLPGFAMMSYACCVEPFRAANLLGQRDLYRVRHFGLGATVQSSGAGSVAAEVISKTARPRLDLLVVVSGGDPFVHTGGELGAWLRQMALDGTQIGGVSGGPVVLALAGLMQGRRMTVHWEHATALAEIAPELLLERRLYVIDRDRVTCGGGTAPLDMIHALMAQREGAGFARLVSDWFLHTEIRQAGAPQRGGLSERTGLPPGPLLDVVGAIDDHLSDPLTLEQLAQLAGVTGRQLNRLFRDRLGESTMAYYRRMRLTLARDLLNRSPLRVAEVASATGFSNAAHFSFAFKEQFGHSPSEHRRLGLDGLRNQGETR